MCCSAVAADKLKDAPREKNTKAVPAALSARKGADIQAQVTQRVGGASPQTAEPDAGVLVSQLMAEILAKEAEVAALRQRLASAQQSLIPVHDRDESADPSSSSDGSPISPTAVHGDTPAAACAVDHGRDDSVSPKDTGEQLQLLSQNAKKNHLSRTVQSQLARTRLLSKAGSFLAHAVIGGGDRSPFHH